MKREWLITIRKSQNMTQEQVSNEAFIDRSYYSQLENGKRNPGIEVAINIAKVLDFDPRLFFEESLLKDLQRDKISISEYFNKLSKGKTLYLYESTEAYISNLILFLLSGVKNDSLCFLIESDHTKAVVTKYLNKLSIEIKNIYFINKDRDVDLQLEQVDSMIKKYKLKITNFHFWSLDEQSGTLAKLTKMLKANQLNIHYQNTFSVSSYNAKELSSDNYIKMMRKFPYLMTDMEIVLSPFYDSGKNFKVFPSFFRQDNTN
ncbi:helix-turn-helix domain-containing protein [Ornithinibacillus xuwenensis]|uniref:Helix-turn-helix transcriptional regulator n=1 Tax=Ornithinibacillus xuwenensis TaxID=3144668 RepID=A0ABU9XHW9_9BACI